jgi:hypothetical protein
MLRTDLDVVECGELGTQTIVAPFLLARELRLRLGHTGLRVGVGTRQAILVSPDIFAAFQDWYESQCEPRQRYENN